MAGEERMVVTKATLTLPPARLVVLVVRKVARLPASHHRSPSSERERHTACSNRERGRSGQRSCRDLKIRPVRLLQSSFSVQLCILISFTWFGPAM